MQHGLLFSSLLHIGVVAVAVIGMPSFFDPPPVASPVMTFEVVSQEEIAQEEAPEAVSQTTKPQEPDEPIAETKRNVPPPPPPPAPEQVAALPEPTPEAVQEPEAIPLPKAPEPEPEPEPEPVVAPKPKPKAEPEPQRAVAPPPPRPAPPRPAPKKAEPKKDPPKTNQLASLLDSLNKDREQVQRGDENRKGAAAQPPAPRLDSQPKAEKKTLDRPVKLSSGEMDALRAQLRQCWNFPAGAKNPEDLIVEARVVMRSDRTPATVEILDSGRLSDSFYRAAADAARRALLNPACHPFKLPPDKASLWQTMILTFDPREMLQ
ncbi:MAG: hypothetical protein NXI16_16035 [Alphaproteobacteria bacterium]|nr:hypothetical protein [Alphaproteobacteria bacterium]